MTRNFAFVAIVAIGMTAVIITGGIDLSVGSILCLSAMVTGVVLNAGHAVWVGIAAGLAASLVVGLVNGVLIAYVGIPPFVATLGMLSIARSLAMVASQNQMVYQFGPDHELFLWLGGGSTLGIPNPVVVLGACCLVAGFALRWTRWGARIMAVGRQRAGGDLTGLPVRRIKVGIYMLSAFMAGLAGVLEASWLGGVTTNLGQSMELSVIAAAVIGGRRSDGRQRHDPGRGGRRRADRDHPQQPDAARHQHLLAGRLRRHLHRAGGGVRQHPPGTSQRRRVAASAYVPTGDCARVESAMWYRRRVGSVMLCLLGLGALVAFSAAPVAAQTTPALPSSLQRARELNHQALEGLRKGDYAEAIPKAREALALREKGLSPTHALVGESLQTLADLLRDSGEYAEARPLYERALAIRERALGPEHPAVAWNLHELGVLLLRTGDYATARPLLERGLAIREKYYGPDHVNVATSRQDLGILFYLTGDFAASQPLLERALRIREQALGPSHPSLGLTTLYLGRVRRDLGDYAAARVWLERSLDIRERAQPASEPAIATSLSHLGFLYVLMGEYAKAQPVLERALAIRERVLGPDHLDVAVSLNDLAFLLLRTADYAAAQAHNERALQIQERRLGPNHPGLAQTLINLAARLPRRRRLRPSRARWSNGLWPSASRRWARSTPPWPAPSTRRPICSTWAATTRRPDPSTSVPWRSAKRRRGPTIPTSPRC